MLKYTSYDIVFQEIPDEVTLAINLSNCPNCCEGCHSPELQTDVGEPFKLRTLFDLIDKYSNVTCVCLMGGDNDYKEVEYILTNFAIKTPNIKTAWYSGQLTIPEDMCIDYINYIKLGPYIKEFGGLSCPTTNQRLYVVKEDKYREGMIMVDITKKFWKEQI